MSRKVCGQRTKGARILKRPIGNALDAHDLIVDGIPVKAPLHLVESVPVLASGDVLDKAVGINIRTLRRRKSATPEAAVTGEQGSRVWSFAKIIVRTIGVMGTQEAAAAWILQPAIGLDNRRPINLLATSAGADAVEEYLTRLAFGIYT